MMLVLRPGKGLGRSIGKRYPMGGFAIAGRLWGAAGSLQSGTPADPVIPNLPCGALAGRQWGTKACCDPK